MVKLSDSPDMKQRDDEESPTVERPRKKKGRKMKVFLSVVLIAVLVVLLLFASVWAISYFKAPSFIYDKFFSGMQPRLWAIQVFFGNTPQSFYGEITRWGEDYIVVKDPAYLDIQQVGEGTTTQQVATFRQINAEISAKPEAKIFKDHIIFLQELTSGTPFYDAFVKNVGR